MHLKHVVRLGCATGVALAVAMSVTGGSQSAQTAPPQAATSAMTDAQRCAALSQSDFEGLPDAPTRITSARLVDVPPAPPQAAPTSAVAVLAASPIKQYCQVLGYVAPQNKFELRLPPASQWNNRFHLTPCAGFCGVLQGNACNAALARGYASVTGNGGHDGRGHSMASGQPTVQTCRKTSRGGTTM